MGFWSKKPKSGVGVEVLGQARALLAEGAIEQALERFDAYVAANPNEITGWAELAPSGYARRNQFEFFAVHYAEYVMRRHDIRLTHERDDLGVWDDMAALFDEIGEDASAFAPRLETDRR